MNSPCISFESVRLVLVRVTFVLVVATGMTAHISSVAASELSPDSSCELRAHEGIPLQVFLVDQGTRTPLKSGSSVKYRQGMQLAVHQASAYLAAEEASRSLTFRSLGILDVDREGRLSGPNLSDWRFLDPDSLVELGPVLLEYDGRALFCISFF